METINVPAGDIHKIFKELKELREAVSSNLLLQKSVMRPREAAEYLGISLKSIYLLTRTGAIAHYKPTGKLIYFSRVELDNWILTHGEKEVRRA